MHLPKLASASLAVELSSIPLPALLPREICQRSLHGSIAHVECTYRTKVDWSRGDDLLGYYPDMPRNYTNMQFEIFGGSGGGSLGRDDRVNTSSRGLGVYAMVQIPDNLPTEGLNIYPGSNGIDATLGASGERVIGSRWSDGGQGGQCRGFVQARHAGSGGSASAIRLIGSRWHSEYADIVLGGGAGAGAVIGNATAQGGHAALLSPDQAFNYGDLGGPGEPLKTVVSDAGAGLPEGLSGFAGGKSRIDHIPQVHYKGRDGLGAVGHAVCLAGGGAGGGFNTGSGGNAFTSDAISPILNAAAGSGGGGASYLNPHWNRHQNLGPIFKVTVSQRMYTNDPRIVWSYDETIIEHKSDHKAKAESNAKNDAKSAKSDGKKKEDSQSSCIIC